MAQSTKGAGNLLVPLAVVAAVVAIAIAVTFTLSGEEPPPKPTVIPEETGLDRPTGAGTVPEGRADETEEGISDQLDEVEPAAPGVESVPPAELATEEGADDGIEGETDADENVADALDEEPVGDPIDAGRADDPGVTSGEGIASEGGDADADVGGVTATDGDTPETEIDAESPIDDAGSATAVDDTGVVDPEGENYPAGRDAQTELTPEEGQDVVRDTDDGGTAFIPTPSGPEGRDNETIADE